MQKIAQTRNIWNRMREGIGWDSKEYAEANQKMRDTDDHVRAIISGTVVENFQPLTNRSMKDILKSARSNLNRREYAKSVGDLSLFHRCIVDSLDILKEFDDNLSKEHSNFLLQSVTPGSDNYDPEYAQYLEDLRKRFSPKPSGKTAYYSSDLVKEAGITDFMSRFSDRGRELAAWEKRYPHRAKSIKIKTTNMVDISEKLLNLILKTLKVMAKFRDARKIDNWYDETKKIIRAAEAYHKSFQAYYDAELKQLFESREFVAREPDKTETIETVPGGEATNVTDTNNKTRPEITDAILEDIPVTTTSPATPSSPANPNIRGRVRPVPTKIDDLTTPAVPARDRSYYDRMSPAVFPSSVLPSQPMSGGFVGAPPSEFKLPKPEDKEPKQQSLPGIAHTKFFSSLETLSNEHPAVLAKYILKYAKSIQQSDPLIYNKLIDIVKSIKA